ncbi:alanine racemase [Denitrovibrio acetiphilus DSM 12809]|uniref:Alanine racemase n=1 Tax=Denitrovibrio acetiphilus (strain DSM 12809 / NBRC 114555 / N2460) TaxID=522772 RepID=D4H827_DENA2|nr:alanine racemase [Denitrovibrio acetiphilus]ADD68176.1 alanine racemase [Denitrovibrio acetiphilus DSM 12809]
MNSKLKALRPTYAEIDLRAFGKNIETARELSGTDIIAIVKADAYSHGELEMCGYAYQKHNCTKFAVATILEAIILREHLGEGVSIFVLGYIDETFYEEAYEHNIIFTINDNDTATKYNEFLQRKNLHANVTVKINTGMNRLGFRTDMSWYEFSSAYPALRPIHIMSHLSSADTDREYTYNQIEEFHNFIAKNKIRCHTSLLNSSGIAGYENKFSLTRPGIMLYGYLDGGYDVKLEKVMRIYSRIVQIQYLRKGDAVSYSRKFHADRNMAIGVVPIGYADGYPRCLSNKSHVFVDGIKCPVIGNVCMDMMMVDLTGVNLNGSLKVEVLGDSIDADELAEMAGTISYEILTGIQNRIPRIYID